MIDKTIAGYSVTVAEVKKQLNIESTFVDDDAYIQTLIEAATDYISGKIAADVETTDCVLNVEEDLSIVHNAPFQSLTKVTNSSDVDVTENCSVVSVHSGFTITFPEFDKYRLEWKSGYGTIPPGLKQAIIIKAADLYEPERASYLNGVTVSPTHVIPGLISKYQRSYWG